MRRHRLAHGYKALLASIAVMAATNATWAGPKVISLDQCADQYVVALAARSDIAGLSYRARDSDSYLRAEAAGLPQRRATLESVLGSGARIVVREWGGDVLMDRRLQGRGVQVVRIDDAQGFDGVRANVRRVAAALGRPAAGETLLARMDGELKSAEGASGGRRALYLTPGGFTAGPDTLVGAMLAAAGLRNAAPGRDFAPMSLERLTADPPDAFVLGFFDPASMPGQRWSIGRHQALRRAMDERVLATLPASILGCPAWFAADGALALARALSRP